MDGGEIVSCELVVSCGDTPEILEPAETSFDDVSTLVGNLVKAMQDDAVRLVWNDGPGAALDDVGSQGIAVIALVGDERAHGRGERQHVRGGGDVGVVTGRQMKRMGSAIGVTQRVDFGGAPAARATDVLRLLPPFPPLAERWALIDVESSDNVTESLPALAKAEKIAAQRPRLAQRLKRL